ncbi:MAG: hypothetical protein KIT74_06375 [Fimbriimonadales bacterium]|nr:hypothetical protein [Fimbriimonadales bacterium]
MKKYALIFALAIACAFVVGCNKTDEADAGTDTPGTSKPADNGEAKKPDAPVAGGGNHVGTWTLVHSDEAKKMFEEQKTQGVLPKDAEMPVMSFTLTADGNATLSADFMGDKFSAKGTYTVEGDKIVIKQTEVLKNGKPDTEANMEDIVIVWSADKTMLESEGGGDMKMQFKKS